MRSYLLIWIRRAQPDDSEVHSIFKKMSNVLYVFIDLVINPVLHGLLRASEEPVET